MNRVSLLLVLIGSLFGQTPETDKAARIVVFQQFRHSIPANPLFCDGVQVAQLGHRPSYFVLKVSAGEHSFRGKLKSDELIIDTVAGQTYYLQFVPGWRTRFIRQTASESRLILGKLQPIDPADINDSARVSLALPKENQ